MIFQLALHFARAHWRSLLIGGVLIGAFIWHKVEVRKAHNEGRAAVLREIERTEHEARKRAIAGSRSVDDCYNAGGVWDRAGGACSLPEGQR